MAKPATIPIRESQVWFVVPLVPPSVNHYVKHARSGIHYVTKDGLAFKEAVFICAQRRQVVKCKAYSLEATVYLGKKQRLDGDNAWKCIADGLKEAKVIHSDAAVKRWLLVIERDWHNPRTEILVKAEG